jgi:hypothetical protein
LLVVGRLGSQEQTQEAVEQQFEEVQKTFLQVFGAEHQ